MQLISVLDPLIATTPMLATFTVITVLLREGLIITVALVATFSDRHGPAAERVLKQLTEPRLRRKPRA